MERQSEQQQALQKGELEWFAEKIKMFSEEEQKAILASAYTFAEHDLILQPSITIQPNEMRFLQHGQEAQRHCEFLVSGF